MKATMTDTPRYSMVIEWSDDDHAYIVSLPEWGDLAHTHVESYAEAVAMGEELLAGLVASRQQQGEQLPTPHVF